MTQSEEGRWLNGRQDHGAGDSYQGTLGWLGDVVYAKAVSESRKLQQQLTRANRAMQEAQRAASAEQRATGHVSAAQYERIAFLQGQINALTQRRSDILDAQAKKENAGNKFSAATGNLAKGAAVVAAGAAPLAAMIGTAATFEQAMSKVKAITNSSNEDMARLNETAQQLGASTQFSATQAAEAMSYLGMAGWKTDQIIAGMPGMLDLAAASGSDLATVADIVSDDLTAFGMSADQAGHMADVMAAASTNANTNVEMMGMTFKYAGAVAGALGYSLEDVSIATGLMANAGIKADQAGTSLRAIMTRLIDPPKMPRRHLTHLASRQSMPMAASSLFARPSWSCARNSRGSHSRKRRRWRRALLALRR